METTHVSTTLPIATSRQGVSQRLTNLTHMTSNSGPKQPDTQRPGHKVEEIITQIYHEYTSQLYMNHMQTVMLHQRDKERVDMEEQIRYLHGCIRALNNRSWKLEQLVNKLKVELASRDATLVADTGRKEHQ